MFNANILKNRNASPFRTKKKSKNRTLQMTQHASTQRCTKATLILPPQTCLPAAASLPSAQVPKAGPSITLNSSSSWIPTINQSPSPTDSAKGPRSITSPDGLAGVEDPPLPPKSSHLSSSFHTPSPDITACSDSCGVSDLGASPHFPFHYSHCGRRKRSNNWYSLLWWDVR